MDSDGNRLQIVVVPDTGGTRPCMSAPSVWDYNYYMLTAFDIILLCAHLCAG